MKTLKIVCICLVAACAVQSRANAQDLKLENTDSLFNFDVVAGGDGFIFQNKPLGNVLEDFRIYVRTSYLNDNATESHPLLNPISSSGSTVTFDNIQFQRPAGGVALTSTQNILTPTMSFSLSTGGNGESILDYTLNLDTPTLGTTIVTAPNNLDIEVFMLFDYENSLATDAASVVPGGVRIAGDSDDGGLFVAGSNFQVFSDINNFMDVLEGDPTSNPGGDLNGSIVSSGSDLLAAIQLNQSVGVSAGSPINASFSSSITAVPEPGSATLFSLLALAGIAGFRRRK